MDRQPLTLALKPIDAGIGVLDLGQLLAGRGDVVQQLAERTDPVLALQGRDQGQALLDLFTIRERLGAFEGLKHDGTLKDLPILGTVSLECKQRKEGAGRLLESWCDGADLLITRADRAQPMVHMPLEMLFQVLKAVKDMEESQ